MWGGWLVLLLVSVVWEFVSVRVNFIGLFCLFGVKTCKRKEGEHSLLIIQS